ncbi:MCE family protein [Nocardia jejuensis]|uniref:MCE family protein n=1 Tax=Nocardia jejuensis TaxID=328049 RepID=UPI000AE80F29|nr:MCE family protein [Nocardia jejuensis]
MASPIGAPFVEKPRPKRPLEQGWVIRLAGAGLVLSIVAVVVICLVSFAGGFQDTVKVIVASPRAGLVMDKDAKVKIRGVEIGHVAAITDTTDGARIELAIDPDKLKMVPANAGVDINSTTVFGAKYINFTEPQSPSSDSLKAGSVVQAGAVTVEFNTLFQHLNDVLAKVEPEKLNATLTALGQALEGRGDKIGQLLVDSDQFLKDINPSLPDLQRDLQTSVGVTNLYADVMPDLLRTTGNMTVTGGTLVDQQANLDRVLLNLVGLANDTGGVLKDNAQPLVTALDLLRPTAELLNEYNPTLYCLVVGAADALPVGNRIFGGDNPWVALNAGFMPGGTPYSYPKDLPKVNATGGSHCEGVLDRVPGSHANYLVTDTTEGEVWVPPMSTTLNGPRVFQMLFAGLPGVPNP